MLGVDGDADCAEEGRRQRFDTDGANLSILFGGGVAGKMGPWKPFYSCLHALANQRVKGDRYLNKRLVKCHRVFVDNATPMNVKSC